MVIFSFNRVKSLENMYIQNFIMLIKFYSLRFILVVVLGLCTQIKKTFNFTYFQNKNTITNTPNHISTNRKLE